MLDEGIAAQTKDIAAKLLLEPDIEHKLGFIGALKRIQNWNNS